MQQQAREDERPAPPLPELRTFRRKSALPDPETAQFSAKTVDGSLSGRAQSLVLDEKATKPQCQKMVRSGDLITVDGFCPSGGAFLLVIPANAGIHNHRRPCVQQTRQAIFAKPGSVAMGPGLRRDDR